MTDVVQGSLQYFLSRPIEGQWQGFLRALAAELGAQMPADELRAFFFMIGGRMAQGDPLPLGRTLSELERGANDYFRARGWGWVEVRDLHSSLEFVHSCAPLRQAFGEQSLEWTAALLEGVYATWLRQVGATAELELHQVGGAEAPADTLRFRLAHPSHFA